MKKIDKKAFIGRIIKLVIVVLLIVLLVFLIKNRWNVSAAFSDMLDLLIR